MPPRYLFGPVSGAWEQEHLADSRQAESYLCFDGEGSAALTVEASDHWESFSASMSLGPQLEAVVVCLNDRPIPPAIWQAPLPLIVWVEDWQSHWHSLRQVAPHCDLLATDANGVAVLKKEGIEHAFAVELSGLGRTWLRFPWHEQNRDIDLLVVGTGALPGSDHLALLPRLMHLRPTWNVVLASEAEGDTYRQMLARSRAVFHLDGRLGHASQAVVAGALLVQHVRHRQTSLLRDGEECVWVHDHNLEERLEHFLRDEPERLGIVANASRRLPEMTFAVQWDQAWSAIAADLPSLRERAARRIVGALPGLATRTCLQRTCTGSDPALRPALLAALQDRPRDAALHHALGLAALRGAPPDRMPSARVEAANAFQDAWRSDPRHVVAGLSLAEVLLAMGQTRHAEEQVRRTLAMLEDRSVTVEAALDLPPAQSGTDEFAAVWEAAAWQNAGEAGKERAAKLVLIRRRLYQLLARLHDDLAPAFIAYSLRPDLFVSQAWLGCALARQGRLPEAAHYLRAAVAANPLDAETSRVLHDVLGKMGHGSEQQQLARLRRMLSEAGPELVPPEPWFAQRPLPPALPAVDPLRILWHGSQTAVHSLALVNRELCVQLVERGHELSLQPPRSADPPGTALPLPEILREALGRKLVPEFTIGHQWPPDFTPPREGYWIIQQPWEFGSLPRAWLEPMVKLVDDVWVPSHYVRDGYLRSGLASECVHVVPHGVGEVFLRDGHAPYPLRTSKRFKFLFVGGTLERKGIDLLLKAYVQTFSAREDVCLVVKDMGVGTFYQGQTAEQAIARLTQQPHAPEIEYIHRDLTVEEMAGLYAACDCLVHPYRGEGFGLPIAEAMACGLPVIVTGNGATLDFCREEHAVLLPAMVQHFRDKHVGNLETVDRPWWLEPDIDFLRLALRRAVERPEAAKARLGQEFIRAHFTWKHAASVAEQRLYALRTRPIKRRRYQPTAAPVFSSSGVPGQRPRVSLAMIVKNEEANLRACLESVADLVDEMVIVDTGSSDGTKTIAAAMGARVFDFPWVDSFSAARNESLRHATGEWIFWMDADDRIDEANREKLRGLFGRLPSANIGFVMKCLCLSESKNETVVDHVRLFRNHPVIRWTFRIHEQILPAIRKLGGEVRWSDVVIRHVGYIDGKVRKRKLERDLRLLTMEQKEQPENPFTLFNLASVFQEQGRVAEALDLFRGSLRRSAPEDSIVRKLYAQIVQCHRHLGQINEALQASRAGRQHYPEDLEILFQEALAHRDHGDRPAAIACLERILAQRDGAHFASVDTGLRGYKTRHNLAVFLQEEGRPEDAERHWRQALAEQPNFLPAHVGLTELALARADWPVFAEGLAHLRQAGGAMEAFLLEARRHLAQREFARARETIAQAISAAPQAVGPRVILTHILLQEGADWRAAEQALRDVLALAPNHAESRRNLEMHLRKQQRGG